MLPSTLFKDRLGRPPFGKRVEDATGAVCTLLVELVSREDATVTFEFPACGIPGVGIIVLMAEEEDDCRLTWDLLCLSKLIRRVSKVSIFMYSSYNNTKLN